MRRRLVNVVTGLSLLLCAAAIALWIVSDAEPFQWEWTDTRGPGDAAWSRGQLCVGDGRIGYVAWIPGPKALMRYAKPRRRFHRMTADAFGFDHMSLFDPWTTGHLSEPAPMSAKVYWWRGIQYSSFSEQFTHITLREIWLPFWLIVASLFMLPLRRMTLWLSQSVRANRRRRQGRCTSCGYDLVGNASGTCPECGIHADIFTGSIAKADGRTAQK